MFKLTGGGRGGGGAVVYEYVLGVDFPALFTEITVQLYVVLGIKFIKS